MCRFEPERYNCIRRSKAMKDFSDFIQDQRLWTFLILFKTCVLLISLYMVNGCYMRLCNSESVNYRFLHCTFATDLWNMLFSFFGRTWAMLGSLRETSMCCSWKVGKSIKKV